MRKNIFTTQIYYLKDFESKAEMLEHFEYKIKSVIEEHESCWKIENVQRNITDDTASAIIYMIG